MFTRRACIMAHWAHCVKRKWDERCKKTKNWQQEKKKERHREEENGGEREREGDRTRSHFMLANLFSFNRDIAWPEPSIAWYRFGFNTMPKKYIPNQRGIASIGNYTNNNPAKTMKANTLPKQQLKKKAIASLMNASEDICSQIPKFHASEYTRYSVYCANAFTHGAN